MREIEPDNALVWLVDLPQDNPDEAAALDAALAQAVRATRVDTCMVERTARDADLLGPSQPSGSLLASAPEAFFASATAEDLQMITALSVALEATPPIAPFLYPGKAAAADPDTTRHAACRAIADILAGAFGGLRHKQERRRSCFRRRSNPAFLIAMQRDQDSAASVSPRTRRRTARCPAARPRSR